MPDLFKGLRERLLRAGLAPHTADRYVSELHDHLGDLEDELAASGLSPDEARAAATRRLGDIDTLVRCALTDRRALSFGHRAPWLTFVLAPVAAYALTFAAALMLLVAAAPAGAELPRWFAPVSTGAIPLLSNVLPIGLGWFVARVALRQHCHVLWPIAGAVVLCVLAAALNLTINTAAGSEGGEIALALTLPSLLQLTALVALSAAPLWLARLAGGSA